MGAAGAGDRVDAAADPDDGRSWAGLGPCLSSSLTTRYRNLQQVVGFGTQLLMYATPVIYPVSAVPPQYR